MLWSIEYRFLSYRWFSYCLLNSSSIPLGHIKMVSAFWIWYHFIYSPILYFLSTFSYHLLIFCNYQQTLWWSIHSFTIFLKIFQWVNPPLSIFSSPLLMDSISSLSISISSSSIDRVNFISYLLKFLNFSWNS